MRNPSRSKSDFCCVLSQTWIAFLGLSNLGCRRAISIQTTRRSCRCAPYERRNSRRSAAHLDPSSVWIPGHSLRERSYRRISLSYRLPKLTDVCRSRLPLPVSFQDVQTRVYMVDFVCMILTRGTSFSFSAVARLLKVRRPKGTSSIYGFCRHTAQTGNPLALAPSTQASKRSMWLSISSMMRSHPPLAISAA